MSRAVQNLVQPDVLQSQAVDVRMELDLRIGIFQNTSSGVSYHKRFLLTKSLIITTCTFLKQHHQFMG